MMSTDAHNAFSAYISVRDRLPFAEFPTSWVQAKTLEAIVEPYDVIMLDAYGILNVGEVAIEGAASRIASLRECGKKVMVVSNSAAYPKPRMMERYARLGFDFTPSEVVTSREALVQYIEQFNSMKWGMMLNASHGISDLESVNAECLTDEPSTYDAVDGFLLFGADAWSDERQEMLEGSLRKNPRPVIVGNPDMVAPRERGLSREPGYFAHRLADKTSVKPRFIGKPFKEIYDLALSRQSLKLEPSRVLMVGDTLHTDILGGSQMGFDTALVMKHGLLSGFDADKAIKRSGIVPNFVIDEI
ncbi:HAD-IIA family hydrolase [Ahrensia kielensis]|uniref:HAD-IIA family hydrolase n=1 Tax=Ahrensia kielensis TaxID=76980 RepID=A0ABU9T2J6_9HYPH